MYFFVKMRDQKDSRTMKKVIDNFENQVENLVQNA